MNEFLDWLKEECLPGVWSKGVALSRNSKSIERISQSNDSNELKFKIQTTERVLAFQVTLWLKDQDAHCNCDSKIEPCHHIVGVALALQNGIIPEVTESAPSSGSQLKYTWVYTPAESGKKSKISLKRTLFVKGEPQALPGSLVSLMGGIQSGRIKSPLPSITPIDLRIDELFAHGSPSWIAVLKAVSDLPPFELEGHPTLRSLKIRTGISRPSARIIDSDHGGIQLISEGIPLDETLDQGLALQGETLFLAPTGSASIHRFIAKDKIEHFVRTELSSVKDQFDLSLESTRIPEIVALEPTLTLHSHSLADDLLSVTARIEYPTLPSGQILSRNLKREGELIKEARAQYGLNLDQPQKWGPREALTHRDSLSGRIASEVDGFLNHFLNETASISLTDALKEKETLLKLLALRESKGTSKERIHHLLSELNRGKKGEALPEVPVRPELWDQLRDYQRSGVRWLFEKQKTLQGAILADDMGLGKTIQTLALLNGKCLVLVPTSLLKNWKDEAQKFRPDLKVQIYHGPNRIWNNDADLTLSTYSILRGESGRFSKLNWATIVLDEAHLIRNPETQAAVAVTRLNAQFRIALTGTPIQNRKRDLFSLFQFVSPDLFTSESEMEPKLTAPFFLRRTKNEVLKELPPKTYLDHVLTLSDSERSLYQAIYSAAKSEILERMGASESLTPFTFFEVLLRARQVCNHPGLIDPTRSAQESTKLAATLELIEELTEAGHSVLVYSQWTKFLNLLETSLKGIAPIERLDGSTQNRGEVVARFQDSAEAKVFLLSLQAGGVGLNLTKASHVIFCDPWWNPFAELQAEDRAYRMGQEKPVTIHRMLMENTVELDIRALQKEKLKLGEETFKTEDLVNLLT